MDHSESPAFLSVWDSIVLNNSMSTLAVSVCYVKKGIKDFGM